MHHSCGCGASFRRKISGSSHIDKMLYGDNEKINFNICRIFTNIKDKLESEMI